MSKKFISDTLFPQEGAPEAAYRVVWPSLGPKEYSAAFVEHLKETEEKVLKQAKDKALFIEKEAYEKGFAQGEKDGLEFGQKRVDMVVQQMTTLFQEIQNQRELFGRTYEGEMLQLIVSISRKILRHELTLRPDVILATLQEAFRHIVDHRKVSIRLNPADLQLVQTHSEKALALGKGSLGANMIKDPSIARGGCVIDTAFGEIDATIETQFDQIVSLLWERFEESGQLSQEPT